LPTPEQRDGEGPLVADRERNAVTRLHAPGGERLGDRAGPAIELAERERAAVPDERWLLGGAARGGFEAPGAVGRHAGAYAEKALRSIRFQTCAASRC